MTRLPILAFCLLAGALRAEHWPQWRGPFFNGATTETNLPIHWTKTENVSWTTALPGVSGATPVVWGTNVFVTAPNESKDLLLLCLNTADGKIRWQKTVAQTANVEKGRNNSASPSPVTDGNRVIALFASGHLTAWDTSGKPLWSRDLAHEYGHFANMWIYGSSPLLLGDKVFIQVLQRSPVPENYTHARDGKADRESFLLCLDARDGTNLWKQTRKTEAVDESMEAYSTPIPNRASEASEVYVIGANCLTAHRLADGQELWRFAGLNPRKDSAFRIVPSPVALPGLVIACGPKRDPVYAIRTGGRGSLGANSLAWKFSEYPSDCATPLFYAGKLFVLDGDRRTMTCLEPETGTKLWQGNLGVREIFRASPTGADGRIYCVNESGTVVVLDAGSQFKILSTMEMDESPVRSSIVAAEGCLFIRTARHLYCIRQQESPKDARSGKHE